MFRLVSYELADGIATVTMDDGKVNAMSIPMLQDLHACFDFHQPKDEEETLSYFLTVSACEPETITHGAAALDALIDAMQRLLDLRDQAL